MTWYIIDIDSTWYNANINDTMTNLLIFNDIIILLLWVMMMMMMIFWHSAWWLMMIRMTWYSYSTYSKWYLVLLLFCKLPDGNCWWCCCYCCQYDMMIWYLMIQWYNDWYCATVLCVAAVLIYPVDIIVRTYNDINAIISLLWLFCLWLFYWYQYSIIL